MIFQQKLCKIEGSNEGEEPRTKNTLHSTQQGSHSYLMERSKAFPTRKAKRIQHLQTSSITKKNTQENSLGGKEKAIIRNRITKEKTHW